MAAACLAWLSSAAATAQTTEVFFDGLVDNFAFDREPVPGEPSVPDSSVWSVVAASLIVLGGAKITTSRAGSAQWATRCPWGER